MIPRSHWAGLRRSSLWERLGIIFRSSRIRIVVAAKPVDFRNALDGPTAVVTGVVCNTRSEERSSFSRPDRRRSRLLRRDGGARHWAAANRRLIQGQRLRMAFRIVCAPALSDMLADVRLTFSRRPLVYGCFNRNLIKQHKVQLGSDRTSCQSPLANQFRLVLHTPDYWLMLALRHAVPCRMPLAWSGFATLRQSLLKIDARVVEKAARIRIHIASACPDAAPFRMLVGRLVASGP